MSKWLMAPRQGWDLALMIIGALLVGGLILAALTTIPARYRKFVVSMVTFIGGLYFSMEFLLPPAAWQKIGISTNPLTQARPALGQAVQIIFSFALLLGIWNLFQIHGRAVAKRSRNWYNSAAFFAAFFSILIAGLFMQGGSKIGTSLFTILFQGFLTPLDATMFSLIAFYIVSAAYRAFRIKSMESVLMMVSAAIIMLALVPAGAIITSWLPKTGVLSAFRLENIGYWILIGPNMAAQRAIAFGVAVGALAVGLRIWLSLERGSFFDRQL